MTKDEALRLALEALEKITVDVKTTPTAYEAQRQAITAIKEALAQPEQAPYIAVSNDRINVDPYTGNVSIGTVAQPEQEPVMPAPHRTWVGLTEEDISEIVRGTHNTGSFVRAIEKKLKDKNT